MTENRGHRIIAYHALKKAHQLGHERASLHVIHQCMRRPMPKSTLRNHLEHLVREDKRLGRPHPVKRVKYPQNAVLYYIDEEAS